MRYTPLNDDRGKIIDKTLSGNLIPMPRKTMSPDNADPTCKCRYHRNIRHITEECQAMKDKIEELIQVGYLRQ